MYHDEMERYPRDLLAKLCKYFAVGIDELLVLERDSEAIKPLRKTEQSTAQPK